MTKYVLQVKKFAKALCDAGILHEEDLNSITRVVIDANGKSGTVFMHIVRVGDDPGKIVEALAYSGFEKEILENG